MKTLIEIIAFFIAIAVAIAGPWLLAAGIDALAPGMGAVSLVFTIAGFPWLAMQALMSDWALDRF